MNRTLITFLLLFISIPVFSQTTVKFQVNLSSMIEDSSFVPNQDIIRVTGNMYPLGQNRFVQLRDENPVDSVYTSEVTFQNRQNNVVLEYNFQILKTDNKIINESMKRRLTLRSGQVELPMLFFDAFVR